MASPLTRPATYADLLALPSDVRAELLNGTLLTAPAPLPRHSNAHLHEGSWVVAGSFDDTATARVPPFEDVALEIDRLFLPRNADETASEA